MAVSLRSAPHHWLRMLLETRFFDVCPEHPSREGRDNRRSTGCNFIYLRLTLPVVLSALATGLGNHEGHGPLFHGKGGLVQIFEREIVMMLTLCEVQI